MKKHVTKEGTCSDCGSSDIGDDNLNWWCNPCDRKAQQAN